MAQIETWYNQDLQQPVKVHYLDGSLFSHNSNGNRIGVHVFNNGEPVTLSGTVSGYVVTADGSTVPCTGTRSGNSASILIPAAAYQPGAVFITLFITDGTTVTTLASVSTSVLTARTNNQIDPGSVVTDWTQTVNAAMQSVETAAENLGGIIAVPYANITYPVPLGKYTYYEGNLYRCISPIATSESFTAAHWTQVRLGDDVSDLNSALTHIRSHTRNIYEGNLVQGNINSSGEDSTSMPDYYVRTDTFIPVDTSIVQEDNKCYLTLSWFSIKNAYRIFFYDSAKEYIADSKITGSTGSATSYNRKDTFFVVPSSAKYIRFAFYDVSGVATILPSDINDIQLEYGYIVSPYIYPYTAYDVDARGRAQIATDTADLAVEKVTRVDVILKNSVSKTNNIFIDNGIEQGNIGSTGLKNNSTYYYIVRTIDYVSIEAQKPYTIAFKSPANKIKVFFYTSAKEYISSEEQTLGTEGTGYKFRRVMITSSPANAAYLMFKIFGSAGTNTYSPSDVTYVEVEQQGFPNPEYIPPETGHDVIARDDSYLQYACGRILCIGDSLTEGWYATQSAISPGKVINENYPYYLGRMLNAETENEGVSGGVPSTWRAEHPNFDYSDFDTVIVWFGTNGGLSSDDISVSGTETYEYASLIDDIQSSNPKCLIILAKVFVTGEVSQGVTPYTVSVTNSAIDAIASQKNIGAVVDMSDLVYANNQGLHSTADNNHFTKGGNIYVAHRFVKFMKEYFNLANVDFGLSVKR